MGEDVTKDNRIDYVWVAGDAKSREDEQRVEPLWWEQKQRKEAQK